METKVTIYCLTQPSQTRNVMTLIYKLEHAEQLLRYYVAEKA